MISVIGDQIFEIKQDIIDAVSQGDLDLLESLLNSGLIDASEKIDENSFTLLHHASLTGQLEIAKFLVDSEFGVDVNATNSEG